MAKISSFSTVILVSLFLLSIAAATELRNIESITPQEEDSIDVEGDLNMSENLIENIGGIIMAEGGLVDGVEIDNPGESIEISDDRYAIEEDGITLRELYVSATDDRYLNRGPGGDKMNGTLDMDENDITGIRDLELSGNITNTDGGNITFGNSIKVHGDVWFENTTSPSGGGGGSDQSLAQVLDVGNSAGSFNINMNSNRITDLGEPEASDDAVRQQDVEGEFLSRDNPSLRTGNLDMNEGNITSTGNIDADCIGKFC